MQRATVNNQERLFWNVVKGIGITSIVIGHCCGFCGDAIRFVYLYHLAIFFYVSGFLYSEEKYGDAPYGYVAARLRTCWPKYIYYMLIYILLHNVFLEYGIIINTESYGISDIVVAGVSAITFSASETMGGALWFVPILIVASGIFGCIIWAGRRAALLFRSKWANYLVVTLLTVLVGALGIYTNNMGCISSGIFKLRW